MKKCGVFRDSVGTVNFEKVLLCKSVTLFLKLDLVFKTRLKDQYLQTWTDDVASNAKCINYRMYKSDISLEFYITFLPMKLRTVFSCFRCRNHKLPVETGIYKNIPRSEIVCVKCTQSEIGDEFHYIFNCPFFADQRRTYLPKYCHIVSAPKFKHIMNDKNKIT